MPNFDGTGPAGMGPMTGRGAGFCAVPAHMYPGWGMRGRGWGRGWRRGMGWGWRNYAPAPGMPPGMMVPPDVQDEPMPEETGGQPVDDEERRLSEKLRDIEVQIEQLTKAMEDCRQHLRELKDSSDRTADE
jgi:hypothetical protein